MVSPNVVITKFKLRKEKIYKPYVGEVHIIAIVRVGDLLFWNIFRIWKTASAAAFHQSRLHNRVVLTLATNKNDKILSNKIHFHNRLLLLLFPRTGSPTVSNTHSFTLKHTRPALPNAIASLFYLKYSVFSSFRSTSTSSFVIRTIDLLRWNRDVCVDNDHFVLNIFPHCWQVYVMRVSVCFDSLCRFSADTDVNFRWHRSHTNVLDRYCLAVRMALKE